MAIEVTFSIRGKATKQALFIQESDWEQTLNDVRKIIEEQELQVPSEYKFLTLNGNAVAQPSEQNLLLKDVTINFGNLINEPQNDDRLLDLGLKSEKGESKDKAPIVPELWITPLKVNLSAASSETTASAGDIQEDETQSSQQTSGDASAPTIRPSCCPFKYLKDAVKDHGNLQTLMKITIILTILLFALLATVTFTMHVMVRAITGVTHSPLVHDFFSTKMHNSGGVPDDATEKLTNLQVKLSKLEVSSKYEIERITTRLVELEDLYLKDLAVHKRELNMLKREMALAGRDSDNITPDEADQDFVKKRNKKSTRGKGSERNKG